MISVSKALPFGACEECSMFELETKMAKINVEGELYTQVNVICENEERCRNLVKEIEKELSKNNDQE